MKLMRFEKINPSVEQVYNAMGANGTSGQVNPVISAVIKDLSKVAGSLIEASCIYTILPIESKTDGIYIDNRTVLKCPTRLFQGGTNAIFMVATVGPRLSEEASELMKNGKVLEGMILEAYGVVALEEVVKTFRKGIKDTLNKDLQLGFSINPGCQAIPLEAQKVIFSLLETKKIGVGLTEAYLMTPIKSTSVIIPMGESLNFPSDSSTSCELCNFHNRCQYKPI